VFDVLQTMSIYIFIFIYWLLIVCSCIWLCCRPMWCDIIFVSQQDCL